MQFVSDVLGTTAGFAGLPCCADTNAGVLRIAMGCIMAGMVTVRLAVRITDGDRIVIASVQLACTPGSGTGGCELPLANARSIGSPLRCSIALLVSNTH